MEFGHFVALQRNCTKNYNARAQQLFCSLNLVFSDVPVAAAVVVFLNSLITILIVEENTYYIVLVRLKERKCSKIKAVTSRFPHVETLHLNLSSSSIVYHLGVFFSSQSKLLFYVSFNLKILFLKQNGKSDQRISYVAKKKLAYFHLPSKSRIPIHKPLPLDQVFFDHLYL